MENTTMSIGTIYKGNTPLMHFSFVTDSGAVVVLPNSTTQIRVWIHDSAGVRLCTGTLLNLVANAGTIDFLMSAFDTANAGVATIWADALLGGETVPRDFDPQKILIEDVTQA